MKRERGTDNCGAFSDHVDAEDLVEEESRYWKSMSKRIRPESESIPDASREVGKAKFLMLAAKLEDVCRVATSVLDSLKSPYPNVDPAMPPAEFLALTRRVRDSCESLNRAKLEETRSLLITDLLGVVDALMNCLNEWRSQLPRQAIPARVRPDSERVGELMHRQARVRDEELFFVNREDTMKALFNFHYYLYLMREKPVRGGGPMRFPLMDSMYGMGKTTFSCRYLSNLEIFVTETLAGYEAMGVPLETQERFLAELMLQFAVPKEDAVDVSETEPQQVLSARSTMAMFKGVLAELRKARTLYVSLTQGCLDTTAREAVLVSHITEAAERQWGIQVPPNSSLYACLAALQKPVFLVLDEIGRAFERCPDMEHQRDQFIQFLGEICPQLSATHGVYYLLSGKAKFLRMVGIRRPEISPTRFGQPENFFRIHLNPIGKEYYERIFENTVSEDGRRVIETLVEKCPHISRNEIIDELFKITGGHPRCLLICLKREGDILGPLDATIMGALLDDVEYAIKNFPTGIRELYQDRFREDLDLTRTIAVADGCEVTRLFLASCIHAGMGLDPKRTGLTIMPAIADYIESYFSPFSDYLIEKHKSLHNKQGDEFDKSRIMENFHIKWLLSVSMDERTSWFEKVSEFCPSGSFLAEKRFLLDSTKVERGLQILAPETVSRSDGTISQDSLASKLRHFIRTGEKHIYFPAPKSNSPDILIVPPITTSEKVIVGVQVKCLYNMEKPLTAKMVLNEAMKLYNIIEKVREGNAEGAGLIRGVFIMCATCAYSSKDFPSLQRGAESLLWDYTSKGDKKGIRFANFEIILINLSTVTLRKSFFGLAIPNEDPSKPASRFAVEAARNYVSEIIETVIKL